MSLSRVLALVTAFSVGGILFLCGWLVLADEQRLLEEAELREITKTAVVFSSAMEQAAKLSASHAETIAEDATAKALLKSGDREALQSYTKPTFDRLANTADIDVLHFHDAEMKSFLRVWEPDNFGQDLSTFRPMVVAVNHDRKTQKGLELGIRGLSLRAVSPILDQDALLGTVETGVSLKALTELAKSATGADYALFLDPAFIKKTGSETNGGALVIDAATDGPLFEALAREGHVHPARAPYVVRTELNERALAILGSPLIDYSGNLIGLIVVTTDFTPLERYGNQSLVTVGAIALGGLLVVFAIVMVAIRAIVIRPMQALAKTLQETGGQTTDRGPESALAEYRVLHDAVLAASGRDDRGNA